MTPEQLTLFDEDGTPWHQRPEYQETPEYETAFLVYLDSNSEYVVTNDLAAFRIRREAKPRDILRGLSECHEAFARQYYPSNVKVESSTDDVADRIRKAMQKRG